MKMTTKIEISFAREECAMYPSLYESGVLEKFCGEQVDKTVDELMGFLDHIQAVPNRSVYAVSTNGTYVSGVSVVKVGELRDCVRGWIMGDIGFDISNAFDSNRANLKYRKSISITYDFGDLDFVIENGKDWECTNCGLSIRDIL